MIDSGSQPDQLYRASYDFELGGSAGIPHTPDTPPYAITGQPLPDMTGAYTQPGTNPDFATPPSPVIGAEANHDAVVPAPALYPAQLPMEQTAEERGDQELPDDRPHVSESISQPTVRELLGSDETAFFTIGEDDVVRPRDPITHDIMRPGEIPPSLLADPELKKGFEFWEQHGHEVRFRSLMTEHATESDLERWGIDLHAEAQHLHDTNGVLFFEGVRSVGINETEEIYRIAARMPEDTREEMTAILRGMAAAKPSERFAAAKAEQLIGTGVTVEFPDFIDGGDSQPDQALTAWATEFEAAAKDEAGIPRFIALDMGFVPYRDMYLVGRIGAALAGRHQPGQITDASFLGGAMHEGVGAYIGSQGAKVTRVGEDLPPHARYLANCIDRGELRPEDFQALMGRGTAPAVV